MRARDNILVVEDDPEMRELLSQTLFAQGFPVVSATSGEDALNELQKQKFRLIVCDVGLPKLGGIDVLDTVKKLYPDIEVIMITGDATVEKAVIAMKKGAYDFLQKPVMPQELVALIDKALEKSELKAEVAVYEASRAVFQSTKIESLMPVVVKLALKILKADDISVMLIRNGFLEVVASHGTGSEERKQARIALGDRVAGRVAQAREPVIINGPLEKDPRFSGVPSLRRINASIVYPLAINGEVLGVLTANRMVPNEPFVPSDLRSAAIFASHIAQALYNAGLYDRLERKVRELEGANKKLDETQGKLVQSQKLAAIGQLAAGVAHEINNPLTAIMGFCQLLLLESSLTPRQRTDLECIQTQSRRCRRIIQDLLQFSRRSQSRKENVQLASLIEGVIKLVQHEFSGSGIAIIQDIQKSLPSVAVDPSQMQQVFLNLLNNARQSMRGVKSSRLTVRARKDKDKAMISFTDNGSGIPGRILDKIFDPFFTTKPVGEGTGLGLSVSYGIVQEHGGTIKVESTEGAGSTFTVELPIKKGRRTTVPPENVHRGQPFSGNDPEGAPTS